MNPHLVGLRERFGDRGSLSAIRRLTTVASAFLIIALAAAAAFWSTSTQADSGTCDVQIASNTTSDTCTTLGGAIVTYIGDLDATLGPAGTGTFNSFVRLQHSPTEAGYNTDGALEFDTKSGIWTHAILVSDVPVISIGGQPYWELFVDINEGNNDKPISLNDLEIYFTPNANLTGYATFSGGTGAAKVYDFEGDVLINDVNQGSGRGDVRYLVPLTPSGGPPVSIPASCGYGSAGCTTSFVLYSKWGTSAGTPTFDGSSTFNSEGGFEEWKVKQYPTLQIVKSTVGGDATFGYTITGTPTPAPVPTPSITTSGGTGQTPIFIVDPGTYTITESTIPTGWTFTSATCSVDGGAPTAYTPGANLVIGETTRVVCTFVNTALSHLQLIKKVTNSFGGTATASSWTTTASGPTPLSGAGGVAMTNVSPGAYTLSESGSVAGYTNGTAYSCVTTPAGGTPGEPVSTNSLTLEAGDSAVCTIDNHDNPVHITLVKNTQGTPTTSTFWIVGPTSSTPSITPVGNPGTGTTGAIPVNAGSYTVAEQGPPSGWTMTGISCTAGSAGSDTDGDGIPNSWSFTATVGGSVTCTFTNTASGSVCARIDRSTVARELGATPSSGDPADSEDSGGSDDTNLGDATDCDDSGGSDSSGDGVDSGASLD